MPLSKTDRKLTKEGSEEWSDKLRQRLILRLCRLPCGKPPAFRRRPQTQARGLASRCSSLGPLRKARGIPQGRRHSRSENPHGHRHSHITITKFHLVIYGVGRRVQNSTLRLVGLVWLRYIRCRHDAEGSHNGSAAVLKTADRKVMQVRVLSPPPYSQHSPTKRVMATLVRLDLSKSFSLGNPKDN